MSLLVKCSTSPLHLGVGVARILGDLLLLAAPGKDAFAQESAPEHALVVTPLTWSSIPSRNRQCSFSPLSMHSRAASSFQELLGYNFSVAVWVGYIALFGIAVETGVVMVVYLHEALNRRLASGKPLKHEDIEEAVIEGAVHRLRPKLMTVCVVLASLIPILWESGIGSGVMKPIAAPIVGGMITSTIHVLILVPVFFAVMKERALRRGTLRLQADNSTKD
jgi:AcrB/AcrD/AcrF family